MSPLDDDEDPFEHPRVERSAGSDDDLTAQGKAAIPGAGTVEGKVKAPPGGPLESALASVPTVVAACVWMVAAGWTFGRAIDINDTVAACLAAVPALVMVAAGPAIATVRGMPGRKRAKRGQSAVATPLTAPTSSPPVPVAALSQAGRDAARQPWHLIMLRDNHFAVVNGGPTNVYDVNVLGDRVQSEGTNPVLPPEGQVSFRDNRAAGEDARVVRVLWRPAPGEDARVWLGYLPPNV
jgi:hypothetical protein